ncbi:hypothetical protein N665_0455s0014 [Sinapis alba]|nr:hypothetical protein N665_0455s0014 [Sinapis alba]
MSVQKSSFFASGLSQQEIDTIQVSYGTPFGSLHELWTCFAPLFQLSPQRTWDDSLLQMQSLTDDRFRIRILRLYWQATIYWTWTKWNSRLHRNTYRTVATLVPLINRQIKEKILSVPEINPSSSSSLMQVWLQAFHGGRIRLD